MVAQRYGTEHEELVVEPDAVAVLPRLVWHYGEPFADPSAIPTWYVSETGAPPSHGRVDRRWRRRVLSRLWPLPGDALSDAPRPAAGWGRGPAGRSCSALRAGATATAAKAAADPRRAARRRASSPAQRYRPTIAFFADRDKTRRLWRGDARASGPLGADLFDRPISPKPESLVAGANRADIHTYLPDDLMVKVDVASMAHGLEARSPLLDHDTDGMGGRPTRRGSRWQAG